MKRPSISKAVLNLLIQITTDEFIDVLIGLTILVLHQD